MDTKKMLVKPIIAKELQDELGVYGYECSHWNCPGGCLADCVENAHCNNGVPSWSCTGNLTLIF